MVYMGVDVSRSLNHSPSVARLRHPAEAAHRVAVCSLPGLWRGEALTNPCLSNTACISSDMKTLLPIYGFENAAGKIKKPQKTKYMYF